MAQTTRGKLIARYVFLALSIAVMVLIFCFSAQNGEDSGKLSGDFSSWLKSVLEVILPDGAVAAILANLRKLAHVFLYACLSCFVTLCVLTFPNLHDVFYWILPIAICFLYACSDELHQAFVPDRSGKFTDVLVDAIGFITVALLINGIRLLAQRIRQKKEEKKEEK